MERTQATEGETNPASKRCVHWDDIVVDESSSSTTSYICLMMGSFVVVAALIRFLKRNPPSLKL